MRHATAAHGPKHVLWYLRAGLEGAHLSQETAHHVEAMLIAIRMLALRAESNPVQDQGGTDRPEASTFLPESNETPEELLSVPETPAILIAVMRIGLGHRAPQSKKFVCVN
jgi:hypothetical protein